MPGTRVLAIGLDSVDVRLASRWRDAGELPVLASIRDRGASGVLATPRGLGDDAVWSSFATALFPGRHGRYHHRQLCPGSYTVSRFREARGDVFWDVLGRAGFRTAAVDVPKCKLARDPHVLQLRDWLVHGRDGPTSSLPPDLAQEVLARYGDDTTDRNPEYLCTLEALPVTRQADFVDRLVDSVERKAAAALDLLGRVDWDMFLVVFKEAHCAGHQFWHLADPNGGVGLAAGASRDPQAVLRVYRALDDAIGRLLPAAGPDCDVIVFSDLGMAANITGEHLLDDILLRLEGFAPLRAWQRLRRATARAPWLAGRVTELHRYLYRYRMAFQVEHNELSGAVRVNLRGREPKGRVSRGPEMDAVLGRLTESLLELVDESGNPIVERVLRSDDLFPGEGRDLLPDLFVLWNRRHPIDVMMSPAIGTLRIPDREWRTGNHAEGGFFHACGPSVATGRRGIRGSITDLGPTIAHLLGVTMPGVDGRPLEGFTPAVRAR